MMKYAKSGASVSMVGVLLLAACSGPMEDDALSIAQELEASSMEEANASGNGETQCEGCTLASAGAKDECSGYVTEEKGDDGTVKQVLHCEGSCEDGSPCEKRARENHHGGVREWCGCSDARRSDCHIVVYTPGEGESGGDAKVLCAGACEDGATCEKRKVEKENEDGESVTAITCQCG